MAKKTIFAIFIFQFLFQRNPSFLVLTIDEVLKIAKANNLGLARQHNFFYLFNGAYWMQLNEDEIKGFLGEASIKMGVDRIDSKYHAYKDQLFKQFVDMAVLPVSEQDNNKVLINLLNGTFEITPDGGNIRPFDSADHLKYQLPFEYNPKAKAPIFETYLKRVQPDEAIRNILAEFIGYVFAKHLKLEKTLLLYGSGSNGKSVFFEIIQAFLGRDNVSNYSLQSLTDEKGYHRANIGDKLLNYASEINGKLETHLFKALVSGEPVEARQIYGQPFIIENYARLLFNCNELPSNVEHTNAYFRRFMIVPFDVTISDEEKDPELAKKIIERELSGVFNWVLEGLERLLARKKFTHSEKVAQQLKDYRHQSDSVQLFLTDEDEGFNTEKLDPNLKSNRQYIKYFYGRYKDFCLDDNYRPVSKRKFKQRLEKIGVMLGRDKHGNYALARPKILLMHQA